MSTQNIHGPAWGTVPVHIITHITPHVSLEPSAMVKVFDDSGVLLVKISLLWVTDCVCDSM